jgi:predicted deacylase
VVEPILIGGTTVGPGERERLELPAARLPTHTMLNLPVTVINGKDDGPCLWLSAALHGDELNGVEIIRRVLRELEGADLRGALFAVPIVNVFGFVQLSRYLPDRRDLNRAFPGSQSGSLASRLAHQFMTEIVSRCTHGIDLHTAAPPRTNLPQVRGNLDDPETFRCAEAFGAPIIVHNRAPRGALRWAAVRRGAHVLLYEAGESLRFNADAIQAGVDGVLRVMAALEMIGPRPGPEPARPWNVRRQTWIRARQSGVLYLETDLGQRVAPRQQIGVISDPFGDAAVPVRAPYEGLVIGHTVTPLVHQGDGIVHLARTGQ